MKKNKLNLLIICFLVIGMFWIWTSFADKYLNMWEFLTVYFEWIATDMPNSWQYIQIKYDNVKKWSELYKSLQKWIYLDYFPNAFGELPVDDYISQERMAKLLWIKQDRKFSYSQWEKISLERTKNIIEQSQKINPNGDGKKIQEKIFDDIKDKLEGQYIYPEKIKENQMLYGSIKWYIEAINDKYTVFFPPVEAKNFEDSIDWSFEWIWAYIEMIEPWEIIIKSPLKNSPAEKYWAKAWDVIVKVWENEAKETTTVNELVGWIKWPEGTFVDIVVKRWYKEVLLKIKRGKIVLPNVEYEIFEGNNCYVSINQFNFQSRIQFKDALDYFEDKNCNKYIFDVRNNPGWVLDDVRSMLNYFVPQWEKIVTIKQKNWNQNIIASDSVKKLTDKKIVVLINWWSASAGEIFAWVIKDYVSNSVLIWEKTFGKWSVQTLVEYIDWSTFKYTIAKRYTWKSEKNIDLEWIEPDIKIEDKKETEMDEVLEVAKIFKFN